MKTIHRLFTLSIALFFMGGWSFIQGSHMAMPLVNKENFYFKHANANSTNLTRKRTAQTWTYYLEASVFKWEIAPGKIIEAWGYNHQVPGPVLKAKKGDTLIIRFKNNLPDKTTIHWHGLRVPSIMDGTEDVQKAVQPGEEFVYRFVVPDAGTFWYHPHSNETVQLERGLYGSILVEDEIDPVVDADRILLMDDMKLTSGNAFKRPFWFFSKWLERHNGREGQTLLVNGKEKPELDIAAGQVERWRFTNVSNARYIQLSLGGRDMKLIGNDGGLLERPVVVKNVLIAPGERVDIAVGPFKEGERFSIGSLPYDRGTGISKELVYASVKVGKQKPSRAVIPDVLRSIPKIASLNSKVTRRIKLHGRRSWRNGVDFTINDHMHLQDAPVKVGELQIWEISNPSMMDHPFHLHGFFFQVIEVNGKAVQEVNWKDTYNIRRNETVKIAWMPDNRPGEWMYHCHILEHHAAGMMAHFQVVNSAIHSTHIPSTKNHIGH